MRRAALAARRWPSRSACGSGAASSSADPGVTPTTILIGGTVPLSGEAAAFGSVGPGAKAYFDYVNARGGVNGRKIDYRYYDDGYNPAQTVQLTRQARRAGQGASPIFNSVGTANNIADPRLPERAAGAAALRRRRLRRARRSPRKYPWTMGFLQSYRGEGAVYGRDIAQTEPAARIAVLLENTDLGKDMARGLSRAIAGKGPKIVASRALRVHGEPTSPRRSRS